MFAMNLCNHRVRYQSSYNQGSPIMKVIVSLWATSAALLCASFCGTTLAFGVVDIQPTTTTLSTSRRAWFQQGLTAAAVVAATTSLPQAASAASTFTCPPRSNNCIVTSWTAPAGTKNVASSLTDILSSYPQAGQADVDKGGWTIVANTANSIAVEYKSGIGNFAKFFNGGKPFVDDLVASVDNGSSVTIKSASRVGDSDLGVNLKRLQYLGAVARDKGWTVPEPKY
jgi:uncharacterized protein (DUF1499 family)